MSQWEGSYYLQQGNQLKCLATHALNNLNLSSAYHMNGVFQISRLFYLYLPLLLFCHRRRVPKSYDWIKRIAQCETLLFPADEGQARQGRTQSQSEKN